MNTTKLADGETHRILFSSGKLYFDGVQIAGEGIVPSKDIMFEFKVNKEKPMEESIQQVKDPSVLEVNVHDSIDMRDVGPGQR